jgi:hypothetical protein
MAQWTAAVQPKSPGYELPLLLQAEAWRQWRRWQRNVQELQHWTDLTPSPVAEQNGPWSVSTEPHWPSGWSSDK